MKTTIVTLCYNKWNLTHQFLYDLYRREGDLIDKVIVIENASTDEEVRGGLNYWTNLWPKVSVAWQLVNLGFTIGANTGLKLACENAEKDHLVFLISNDVHISGKFIHQAADILLQEKKYFVGNKLLANDTGWNRFGDRIFPYLEGYFLAATAHGWNEIGYFDENYAPYDFEDIDISTKASSLGYRLTPLNNPAIVHLGGGTLGYNPEREKITRRNQEYFKNKWTK